MRIKVWNSKLDQYKYYFCLCLTAGFEKPARPVSLRNDRSSRAFPSLELDTVVEERSDAEQSTALELSSPD